MESCGIVIQQEQALLVLVHIKLYFLDECNLLLLQEAPAQTVMLQFRVLEGLILAVGGWRRWVRQQLSGRVRHLENAEPAADLLVPGEWPILPLVLLHHVLGAVDNRLCLCFLDNRTCNALRSWRQQLQGVRLLVLHGQAAQCTRRRHRRWKRRLKGR